MELEATVLRVMLKHGFPAASSSSSGRKMVSQETQTYLSGEVALLEKSKNKITEEPSGGNGGDHPSASGSGVETSLEPQKVTEMHPEEILELEAAGARTRER